MGQKASADQHRSPLQPGTRLRCYPGAIGPEYGHQCARPGIPFAIDVQGGYLINKGEPQLLDLSYSAASYVLAISDDTAECVATAFPFAANKI